MNTFAKIDFPVSDIQRVLEPSPIVLISSARKGRTNIMTMGWHMVMEFQPSLVGCVRAVYAGRIHEYRDTGKSSIRPIGGRRSFTFSRMAFSTWNPMRASTWA